MVLSFWPPVEGAARDPIAHQEISFRLHFEVWKHCSSAKHLKQSITEPRPELRLPGEVLKRANGNSMGQLGNKFPTLAVRPLQVQSRNSYARGNYLISQEIPRV